MGKYAVSALVIALLTGCATPRVEAPPIFAPDTPSRVLGRIVELKEQAAWIDFDHAFVSYDGVVVILQEPERAAGKRVSLQFQGEPLSQAGVLLKPGATISFTLQVVPESGCCEPYLKDLIDLEVVSDGS
jgi:hypothetical protein